MLIKWIITALLFVILYHLFRALFVMLKGHETSKSMSKQLGKRVFFSLAVVLFISLSSQFGLIKLNRFASATTHTQTQTNTTTQHQQNASTKQQLETQNVDENLNDL
ncbi:DUF2909 domain-containing protein [Pseudoalteromonas sp. SMS1]|uniref:DUF2909 domain-containing protein n=1 Tax=Pseudoalteromonas sp. SMS1 TaxID=2908894 RepID=UPI001F46DD40|nr:DUF2909 domain-containing protein [Pseudoalteromonas sp. SMS1]MCF2859631.1 DUF2909 domain-containing protein [Pseudoalteromonas sp. SMS1]